MAWAVAGIVPVVVFAVAALLATRASDSWLGLARTIGVAAAVVAVVVELLPAASEALGAIALVVFVAGLLLPGLLERFLPHSSSAGLALTAVAAHQVLDGTQIGVLGPNHGAGVALAFAAHGGPLVAATVLSTASEAKWLGWGAAISLVGATIVGMGLGAGAAPLLEPAEGWIQALAGGLLLHVLAHDMGLQLPERKRERTADLIAALLTGLVTLYLLDGGHVIESHEGHAHLHFLDALLDLTLETAPMLLLGLGLGAFVQAFGGSLPARWLTSGSVFGQATRGAIVGAPLPLCACGILPVARGLAEKGAGPALVVAFLLATPELGVETFALSVQFLGWSFAWWRLVGAVAVAIAAGVVVGFVVGVEAPGSSEGLANDDGRHWTHRWIEAFDELVVHVAPWVGAGLIFAAYVEAFVHDEQIAAISSSGAELPLVTLAVMPSYVCASSATPLAAVLWAKGLSAGGVLTGLLLGPATNVATVGMLRGLYGTRATVAAMVALIVATWSFAFAANLTLPTAPPLATAEHASHEHGGLDWLWSGLLLVLVLRSIWQTSLRGWLATLSGDHSGHDHAHHHHGHHHHHDHHDHDCDHDHHDHHHHH